MTVCLGKNQREKLTVLGCPTTAQIVPCKVALSLVKRGLLRMHKGGFACITPAGLRVLADELEAGRVEGAIEWAKRERAKNIARASDREALHPATTSHDSSLPTGDA
jgi:hypothetical protein